LIVDGQNLLELKGRASGRLPPAPGGFRLAVVSRNLLAHRDAVGNVTPADVASGRPVLESAANRRATCSKGGAVGWRITCTRETGTRFPAGQAQRVAIAVALANQPPLLLPTSRPARRPQDRRQVLDCWRRCGSATV